MTDQWTELEKLAKAATPGPWLQLGSSTDSYNWIVWAQPASGMKREICRTPGNESQADTHFIAAAHPQTILTLIAEARLVEQLQVQLAGCLVAAEGGIMPDIAAKPSDYGWSLAYQRTLDLARSEAVLRKHVQGIAEANMCGNRCKCSNCEALAESDRLRGGK